MNNHPDLFSQPPEPVFAGVRDTSLEAYAEHAESLKLNEQQQLIMHFISYNAGGVTRNELAGATTMRLSSVCGRVNELIKKGLLEDSVQRKCTITGKKSHVITVVKPDQYSSAPKDSAWNHLKKGPIAPLEIKPHTNGSMDAGK